MLLSHARDGWNTRSQDTTKSHIQRNTEREKESKKEGRNTETKVREKE